MGHSRAPPEVDAGGCDVVVVAAQLTTMIAVPRGADDSGTSMPLTPVRTTGTETGLTDTGLTGTGGLGPATSPAATAAAGCWNDDDADSCPSLAAEADAAASTVCCNCLADCDETRLSFSDGLDVAVSRQRLRGTPTVADDEPASPPLDECRRAFSFMVVTTLDEPVRGRLVEGAVLAGTTGGAHRRETATPYPPRWLGDVAVDRPFPPALQRRSSGCSDGIDEFFRKPLLFSRGNSDSRSCTPDKHTHTHTHSVG